MTAGVTALVAPTTINVVNVTPAGSDMQGFGEQLAQQLSRAMPAAAVTLLAGSGTVSQNDPTNQTLDLQIDAFRDQLRNGEVRSALAGLIALLQTAPATISGKNLFRIKANIGHCHHRLGDEARAAEYLLEAFTHAPLDPKAIASKALALLLQRKPQEAYDYAQAQLAVLPDNEPLACYAVQAAAHLPAITDPFAGIPQGLRERREVLVAEIFFYQWRNQESKWIARARRAAKRYPDDAPIARLTAHADVHAYIGRGAFVTTYQISAADRDALIAAAGHLQAHWDRQRALCSPPTIDVVMTAVDAMLGWHLAHQRERAIATAEQLIALGITDNTVMINVGQVLAANDQHTAAQRAFALIAGTPEARWAQAIDAVQRNDWPRVAAILASGDVPGDERCVAETFKAVAPLIASRDAVDEARFEALLEPATGDARALIALARAARERGFTALAGRAFAAARSGIGPESPKEARYVTANYARGDGNPAAVIELLTPIVPIDQPSDTLLWLAEAHADETPRRQRNTAFFNRLPAAIKSQPAYATQYARYLLAGGISRVAETIAVLKQLRAAEPTRAFPILHLALVYRRQNDMQALAALCRDIDLATLDTTPLNRAYIAQILRDGGRPADALRQALAAVRAAPDHAKVALSYVGLLIGSGDQITLPTHDTVDEGSFVRLDGPNDMKRSFVIDGGGALPGVTVYPPDHVLARKVIGKAIGDIIIEPKPIGPPEEWRVAEIKDEYLHLLHTIMETFEERFAGNGALARFNLDPSNFAPVLAHIREYNEARRDLARVYTEQHLPLEFAACMMGGDPLTFAGFVGAIGETILTSTASPAELRAAITFLRENAGRGAVLDSYTACVAAGSHLLPVLKSHFGELVIASTTIDMLDDLILHKRDQRGQETMTLYWANGQCCRHIVNDAEIDAAIAACEHIKEKLAAHTTIAAGHFPDDASPEAAALAERVGEAAFFPMYLAAEREMVFLSDDLRTRLYAKLLTGVETAWLQPTLVAAVISGTMSAKEYACGLAALTARHHTHIAISAPDFATLFHGDDDGGLQPFRQLALGLGGAKAEFTSHVNVVGHAIFSIFDPLSIRSQAATGILLENLIRDRDDYASILGCLAVLLTRHSDFQHYLSGWILGHFLAAEPIVAAAQRFDRLLRWRYPRPDYARIRPSPPRPAEQSAA